MIFSQKWHSAWKCCNYPGSGPWSHWGHGISAISTNLCWMDPYVLAKSSHSTHKLPLFSWASVMTYMTTPVCCKQPGTPGIPTLLHWGTDVFILGEKFSDPPTPFDTQQQDGPKLTDAFCAFHKPSAYLLFSPFTISPSRLSRGDDRAVGSICTQCMAPHWRASCLNYLLNLLQARLSQTLLLVELRWWGLHWVQAPVFSLDLSECHAGKH